MIYTFENINGTLLEGNNTLIILISGSGFIDQDGNSRFFKMNIYKDLAETIHRLGYSVFRYNKRGTPNHKHDYLHAGVYDYVADLEKVVFHFEQLNRYSNIILMGHSEGAMLATLYSRENFNVDGLILLSGAGTSLKTALIFQNQSLINEVNQLSGFKGFLLKKLLPEHKIFDKQNKLFSKLENSQSDVIKEQFIKIPAKWFREHFELNDELYLNHLKALSIPTLVVTGDKDVQANPDDVHTISHLGNSTIETKIIPNMDHILKEFSGTPGLLDIKKQYKQEIKQPIHPELIQSIHQFLQKL